MMKTPLINPDRYLGRPFGKLTIVDYLPSANKFGRAVIVCECECGKVITTSSEVLNSMDKLSKNQCSFCDL